MPALAVVEQLTEAQRQQLHSFYQNEWWTRDRTLEETHRVVDGSQICIGLVEPSGRLVGFSRIITDFTFKALVFDVIVATDYRARGLGDRLMSLILEHAKLKNVRTIELYCLPELVPFYERFGFTDDVGRLRLMRRAAI
jgi:GNAT superfamily N-acetyltransferase